MLWFCLYQLETLMAPQVCCLSCVLWLKCPRTPFQIILKERFFLKFIILFFDLLHTDSSLHSSSSDTVSGIHLSLFLDPFLDYQIEINHYTVIIVYMFICTSKDCLYLLGLHPPVITAIPSTLPVGLCRKQAFQNSSQPVTSISKSCVCVTLFRNTFGRVLKTNHLKTNQQYLTFVYNFFAN